MASVSELMSKKTGKKTYRVTVSINGERKTQAGFKTKREAMAYGAKLEQEAKDYLSHEIPDRPFCDALDRYLESVSPTKKGFDFERKRINSILGKGRGERLMIADVPLKDLQPKHFSMWRDERLKQVSGATVNREWNLLSAVCSYCVKEWGWLKKNPMSDIKRPQSSAPRYRRVEKGEYENLMHVCSFDLEKKPQSVVQRVGAAATFAIETAMRAGEICQLEWGDIDWNRSIAFIPASNTKTARAREIPLSTKALKVLHLLNGTASCQEKVFGLKASQLESNYRKVREKALIDGLRFHDLRREALTRLSQKVDVMTLAKISGHSNLKILQSVYYAPDMAEVALKLK